MEEPTSGTALVYLRLHMIEAAQSYNRSNSTLLIDRRADRLGGAYLGCDPCAGFSVGGTIHMVINNQVTLPCLSIRLV